MRASLYREALGQKPKANVPNPVVKLPSKQKGTKRKRIKLPQVEGDAPQISVQSILDQYYEGCYDDGHKHLYPIQHGGPRRQGVFHPSSLCKEDVCHRALAMEMYSAPQDQRGIDGRIRRIFNNGHHVHVRLQYDLLCAVKALELGEFYDEIGYKPNEKHVAGTTDGGLIINGWPYLLEIKSMRKADFISLGRNPWEDHVNQITIYMKLAGVRAAIILIECKDNQDLREYFVRFDDERWAMLEGKVDAVLEHCRAGTLPPKLTVEDGCDKYCSFYGSCKKRGAKHWEPKEAIDV